MTPPYTFISTGFLPPAEIVRQEVDAAYADSLQNNSGEVADYIPALASVPPDLFGVSVVSVDGSNYSVGDSNHLFSIQSISKPFVFALVCQEIGPEAARKALGVNATGLPFNSVMAIELHRSRTVNPFVNAGAIATTSLVPGENYRERWEWIRDGLSRFAGRDLEVDEEIYYSEMATNQRNQSLAWLLDSYGRIYSDPVQATDLYTRQCSLLVTAHDLAVMGATLADGGENPVTGERVVDQTVTSKVLATLATSGLYDTTGDWLFDTGLPGKSGVGGGIVTISPGKGGLGTFSPRLDPAGNSVRGQQVARQLAETLGLTSSLPTGDRRSSGVA